MIFMHFVGDRPYSARYSTSLHNDNVTVVISPQGMTMEMMPDVIHLHGSRAGIRRALLAGLEAIQAEQEDEDGSESGGE